MAASNLDIHTRNHYDGSHLRPPSALAHAQNRSRFQDENGEGHELYSIGSRGSGSGVSGFESVGSSTSSSHTLPPAPINLPGSVSATTLNTAQAPVRPELPTAPDLDRQPPRPEGQQTNESLRRALHDYHIFLIAISAVIGMGYYVRTGTLLHVGGEGAVIYTYSFLGILAFMVMKGLTTMLRIWPIGGALIVFVEEFVDRDVAKSVAFLYWLTYCFSFASLITTVGSVVDYWKPSLATSVGVSVLFVFLPILANLTDIMVFRNIELLAGSLKLVLALVIILMMNIVNTTIGDDADQGPEPGLMPRGVAFHHSDSTAGGWFASLASSIFLGSFSFVGIEVVAATAQEAVFQSNSDRSVPANTAGVVPAVDVPPEFRPPPPPEEESQILNTSSDNPFQYAHWVPAVATFIYLWGGWIVSHNISWDSDHLPFLPWGSDSGGSGGSIFVTCANRFSPRMGAAVNVLLLINVASTSSTALYVATRTLFGFAYSYTKTYDSESGITMKVMSWLSVKSKFDVPYRAVLVSSWLLWLPFLKYLPSPDMYLNVVDAVAEVASVSCILAWAFVSLAAFNFYGCLKRSKPGDYARIKMIARVESRRWYLSHRIISMLSAILCFVVVIVGGVMTSISNRNLFQYLAAFLPIGIFVVLTWALKFTSAGRSASYQHPRFRYGVDLDDTRIELIFDRLDNNLKHNSQGNLPGKPRRYRDLLGIIDFDWFKGKTRFLADSMMSKRSRASRRY